MVIVFCFWCLDFCVFVCCCVGDDDWEWGIFEVVWEVLGFGFVVEMDEGDVFVVGWLDGVLIEVDFGWYVCYVWCGVVVDFDEWVFVVFVGWMVVDECEFWVVGIEVKWVDLFVCFE